MPSSFWEHSVNLQSCGVNLYALIINENVEAVRKIIHLTDPLIDEGNRDHDHGRLGFTTYGRVVVKGFHQRPRMSMIPPADFRSAGVETVAPSFRILPFCSVTANLTQKHCGQAFDRGSNRTCLRYCSGVCSCTEACFALNLSYAAFFSDLSSLSRIYLLR